MYNIHIVNFYFILKFLNSSTCLFLFSFTIFIVTVMHKNTEANFTLCENYFLILIYVFPVDRKGDPCSKHIKHIILSIIRCLELVMQSGN